MVVHGVDIMISQELKEKIIPNLKIILLEEYHEYMNYMFDEVYVTSDKYGEKVTLNPPYNGPALQFDMLTGSFIEITDWEYIKKVGDRL